MCILRLSAVEGGQARKDLPYISIVMFVIYHKFESDLVIGSGRTVAEVGIYPSTVSSRSKEVKVFKFYLLSIYDPY